MVDNFEAIRTYDRLLKSFSRDLRTAEDLETPNPEDTLEVRAAVVGFSYNSPTEAWGCNHLDYLREHLPSPNSLEPRELLFFSLCLGYLLGLYQADKLSEEKFHLSEAQLPGFILIRAGRI